MRIEIDKFVKNVLSDLAQGRCVSEHKEDKDAEDNCA